MKCKIILKTAVGPSQKVQDFESESVGSEAEHSQTVKAASLPTDYGSKDCAFRPDPTAVFRIIACLLLTSCIAYHPDPVKTPDAPNWKEPTAFEGAFCPPASIVCETSAISPWWQLFNDDLLNKLEEGAIKQSPTILEAIAKLKESEAFYGIVRADQFPHLDLELSYTRSRISQSQPISSLSESGVTSGLTARDPNFALPPIPPPPMPPTTICDCPPPPKPKEHFTALTVLPQVSYEFDFWGKFWQQSASAQQQIKAEGYDLTSSLLLLTTNLADAYLQLRSTDDEIRVLEQNYATRKKAYDLEKMRFDAGLIDDLDVQRAKVELTSIEADLENTKGNRNLLENLVALLSGVPASEFHIGKAKIELDLPIIPAGVPSQAFANRPDIQAGLHLIESSRLDVGVAKTAFFPQVTLFGDYGFISNKTSNLFKWKSHVWQITIDALTPIYDAGKNLSRVRQAVARYEQSVASYLDRVLTAFREVEDALASVNAKKRQLAYLKEEVRAAKEVFRLSTSRYDLGLVDYLDVVDAERALLEAERQEVLVAKEQYSTTVSLIKSLGGSW